MLKKVLLNGTYGYENFISDKEKNLLVSWVNDNLHEFHSNRKGRYFRPLREIENSPLELVEKLKANVIKLEGLVDWKDEPKMADYIGINYEGAYIHPHTDVNENNYIHTRYNIILSWPDEGGESIYGRSINVLKENLVWKCIAGKFTHASKPVKGSKPRITLSLGFLIKE
jgi:hypothetical protein|tara:strand:- start:43 stop:552 length:510 start_codon:yes stop_codon:yes gene_type:complete